MHHERTPSPIPTRSGTLRTVGRVVLGVFLAFAGIAHLSFARHAFQAQVPEWVPLDEDFVVVASGAVELALGGALLVARTHRSLVGWVVAAFFVAVFPGNISQFANHIDSLGLDSDLKRAIRLPFQPLLVLLALWSTGAWRVWRASRSERRADHAIS